MRPFRFPELAILILLLAGLGQAAEPKPLEPKARVHVDRGLAAYRDGRYDEAIHELSAAYKIDPRREILFNWAQAERLSGDCEAAVPLYQEFLDTKPPAPLAKQARRLIEKCGGSSGEREAGTPEPPHEMELELDPWQPGEEEPAETPVAEPEPVAPEKDEGSIWYRDAWGGTLVGVGLVGVGLGATFLVLANRGFADASAADTYPEYDVLHDEAVSTQRIGLAGLIAGGALIAAGVGRWVWVGTQHGGASVVVGGNF